MNRRNARSIYGNDLVSCTSCHARTASAWVKLRNCNVQQRTLSDLQVVCLQVIWFAENLRQSMSLQCIKELGYGNVCFSRGLPSCGMRLLLQKLCGSLPKIVDLGNSSSFHVGISDFINIHLSFVTGLLSKFIIESKSKMIR